jgi:Neuraminidase (sialidase)
MEDKDDFELNYEKSYVAFLDVLGFKQLVYSKKQEDKEKIELYLKTVSEVLNGFKRIPSKKIIGSIVISDSIILTVPFGDNKTEQIFNLRQLCIAILSLQRKLLVRDIWIRGAISYGDTYFDNVNNQIVGSAYVDAYLLEEKMAKYPRVILDNRIIKELNCHNASCLINQINQIPINDFQFYTKDV